MTEKDNNDNDIKPTLKDEWAVSLKIIPLKMKV